MWKQGQIKVNGTTVDFVIKVFEEGSEFGINNGRISKLEHQDWEQGVGKLRQRLGYKASHRNRQRSLKQNFKEI